MTVITSPCITASIKPGAQHFTRSVLAHVSRHQRARPYTPRHNGKVERYNRILAQECLYARDYTSQAQRREAIAVFNHHYNYHRPHTACHDQPPESTPASPTS